jgi:hypothetical protein
MATRRRFGSTWWGRAWVDALEHRARLDPNRLPRGRTYARHDRVVGLEVGAGEIRAKVRGSRPGRYDVRVRVRTYDEAEWARVLDAIAARAAHAAALLDGELDPGVVDAARDVGVDLLPGPGDLQPRCSCPDWADPCKHSAAVCYLVADALDADPFALFVLRGRTREELLAGLRRRRAGGAGGEVAGPDGGGAQRPDPGVAAMAAWHAGDGAGGPPAVTVPHPAPRPGPPAPWPVDPPGDVGFSASGLRALVADAAERAWGQVRGEGGSALELDEDADLARRAAAALGTPAWPDLVARSGLAPTELARRGLAWRHGGAAGLAVGAEARWRPPVQAMAGAWAAVVDAGVAPAGVRVEANRLSLPGGVQLRLGRDGRWWRFEKRRGRYELAAPPADEVEELLDA